ncbi:MAG: chemotaxis protein CheX [Lachnospiraceae bacterium]|nr:chemotaxis protein CheX [Lachnospiraceae bacterium]
MADTLDIKYINPFLKATITVFEMLGIAGGKVGKPSIKDLDFPANTFLIQVGVTGAMKGQVFFEIEDKKAMSIASTMMMGMPVKSLDPMACSALQELGNMILGNTSTLFSTMNIIFDITPPLSMHGDKLKIQTETPAISIPVLFNDEEFIRLYIAVTENTDNA